MSDQESNDSSSQEEPELVPAEEKKRNYRSENMKKARLARLEKIRQEKELKAKQPKKVAEYNLVSDSESESESSDDDAYQLPRPPRKAPARRGKVPGPAPLRRQNGYYKEETSADYDPRDMAMLQMQLQMQQMEKKMKRKARKPVKKQTVVQVLQPQAQSHAPQARSSNDIMLDALLGR